MGNGLNFYFFNFQPKLKPVGGANTRREMGTLVTMTTGRGSTPGCTLRAGQEYPVTSQRKKYK